MQIAKPSNAEIDVRLNGSIYNLSSLVIYVGEMEIDVKATLYIAQCKSHIFTLYNTSSKCSQVYIEIR